MSRLELLFSSSILLFVGYVNYHAGHYVAVKESYKKAYELGYLEGVDDGMDWVERKKDLPCFQPPDKST